MIKTIRVLEVPMLLLLAAMNTSTGWCLTLVILSIVRLWINVITDDSIYKNSKSK